MAMVAGLGPAFVSLTNSRTKAMSLSSGPLTSEMPAVVSIGFE